MQRTILHEKIYFYFREKIEEIAFKRNIKKFLNHIMQCKPLNVLKLTEW